MPILIFLLLLLPFKLYASDPHPEFMAACQNPTEVQREFLQAVKDRWLLSEKTEAEFLSTDCHKIHTYIATGTQLFLHAPLQIFLY